MNLHLTWIDIAPMMEMESLSKVSHVLLDATFQAVGSSGTIQRFWPESAGVLCHGVEYV